MCARKRVVTNNALTCVFGIVLGINVISAIQTSTHRTDILNNRNHIHSLKKQRLGNVGKTIRDAKAFYKSPSKRFDQYLTMARDVLQNRDSYVKSIRSPTIKEETTLVPVVDHFAGIRTWSVPYNDISKDSSSFQSRADDKQNNQDHELLIKTLSPSEGLSIVHKTADTLSSKKALFDEAYTDSRDIAAFAPDIDMVEGSDQNHPYDSLSDMDASRDTGFSPIFNRMINSYTERNEDSKLLDNQIVDYDPRRTSVSSKMFSDILTEEELNVLLKTRYLIKEHNKGKAGARRDYKDFATFQPNSGGASLSDMMAISGGSSFGDFSPVKSSYVDPFSDFTSDWAKTKNRDLESQFFDVNTIGAFSPIGTFRSEGSFSNDESDCEGIETRSCSTNADCSCYGLYQCTDGVCSSKSPIRTISSPTETSRDVQEKEFWHSGPYSEDKLGINN